MSPDPPREDSGDDENRLRRFSGEFIEGIMDDQEFFIVPDAPYELDVEDESDYSDSDEELGAVGGANEIPIAARREIEGDGDGDAVAAEGTVIQGQMRARYRLLIPFTVDNSGSSSSTSASTEEVAATNSESGSSSSNHNAQGARCDANDTVPTSSDSVTVSDSTEKPCSSKRSDPKREIEMSDEKVETIMQVMKNIKLPENAIPKWASEIDEDAWRKKLYDSLESKTSSKSSSVLDKNKEKDSKSSTSF